MPIGTHCSEIIKNFELVMAEHETKCQPFMGHLSMKLAWEEQVRRGTVLLLPGAAHLFPP